MRTTRASSPVRYKPKMMKAKNLYAQMRAKADERAKRKKLEEDNKIDLNDLEINDDVTLDSVLDSVRPEYKDEAQRLQRRLQEIVAEGKTPVADFERDYNDNAPFPSEVRVNENKVEVSAQVPPKRTGAARKSFNRWQPIKPSQAARRDGFDTSSVQKSREDHAPVRKHFQSRSTSRANPRGKIPATLAAKPGHGTTQETACALKRTIIEITSDSESSVAPAKKVPGVSTGAAAMKRLSLSPKRYKQATSRKDTWRASRISGYNEYPTVFESPQSKMLFQLATAEDLRTHFGSKVPPRAEKANRPTIDGKAGSMLDMDRDASTRLQDIPSPEYSCESENAVSSGEQEWTSRGGKAAIGSSNRRVNGVGRSAYTARRPRLTAGTLDDITKSKYSGTAKPKDRIKANTRSVRTAQPNAGRDGGWVRTSNGKAFIPGLAMSNCTDSPDSEHERTSPVGGLRRMVRKKKAVVSRRQDNIYDESEDEDILPPRRKLRNGRSGAKTKLDMPPGTFPADNPPARFIPPMKLAERKKEIMQEAVERPKLHPEARHKRAINRTDLSFVTKPVKKDMTSRIKVTSTLPKPAEAVRMPPQLPDPQLGEEAYHGRVFMTIETELDEDLFGSHLPDGCFEAEVSNFQNDPEPPPVSPPGEAREDILARYMAIAESDPYAGFY